MNLSHFRIQEYLVILYRLGIAFLFYFISRLLFVLYNGSLLDVSSFSQFMKLSYIGLTFDKVSIFYASMLFVVLSIFPLGLNTRPGYQKMLFYVYFIPNLIFYAFNYIDLIYYRFTLSRSNISILESVENESNKLKLSFLFLLNYWHAFLLFLIFSYLWIYLYKRIKPRDIKVAKFLPYIYTSIVALLVFLALMVIGIRGGATENVRPLNIIDASSYVNKTTHSDVVLNTPFCIIRTINKTSFVKHNISNQSDIDKYVKPIKTYSNNVSSNPNIVIFITESFGREYVGAFNSGNTIKDYKGYTPFLDSLSQHSMIYTNAYANGRKSIHGMSSILAGIPSFKDAFNSSPYPNQPIESVVSVLKSIGYDTSFFHGSYNGSMGFLGFSNILGIDNYYGMNEYGDSSDFDGTWGIWDEPFFLFMKKTLDSKKGPFFAANFTVSSHHPFKIPEKYIDKFPEGDIPIHKCIRYTDYAFKHFFESAKNEPWFNNTIFIITADHCNQVYYDEYSKVVNLFAVPILIYKPDNSFKGVSTELAQQIDIYPTVIDLVGYNKPFRSWGRSLLGDTDIKPFVINYSNGLYLFQRGNYICSFDGEKLKGIYSISDINLDKNLIDTEMNDEMNEVVLSCKAFVQDYYDRIVDKKLKP